MNLLLSAYACEPNKGSEPNVGWNWALRHSNKYKSVHVITRSNNKSGIDLYRIKNPSFNENIIFHYYDLPKCFRLLKKGNKGVHLYYFFWQIGIFFHCRKITKSISIDVIHHATFVTVRQPSFLGLLRKRFIFGPVAGGESAPIKLRKSLPMRKKIKEYVRDLSNFLVKFDPFMHITFATSDEIYCTSEQTRRLIPRIYRKKAFISLAISIDKPILKPILPRKQPGKVISLLYVGRLIYLKGVHFLFPILSRINKREIKFHLTIVGAGPDRAWLKTIEEKYRVSNYVTWIPWVDQDKLDKYYNSADYFIFLSLHDSGGLVVLESMSRGVPVISLNVGGPGQINNNKCGLNVDVFGLNEEQLISEICSFLFGSLNNSSQYAIYSKMSHLRSMNFCSSKFPSLGS